jgi:DNA adenine methylase
MTFDPKITAIAPWFGSKRQIAPHIVARLGPHAAYFEPFCGSMAVLLAKPPSRMETVNDLHGNLINMARCIRDPALGPKLYRSARRIIASDDELGYFDDRCRFETPPAPESIDFDRALAFFISSWMGRNGEVGLSKSERGRDLSVRWGAGGGDCSTRFHAAVSSIPVWRRRLRDVLILNRDGFEILEKINDKSDAAIYCDPPYLVKSDRYLHDFGEGFMGDDDHARLAGLLRRFKNARIIVSYYEHPRLAELYPGWEKIDLTRNRNLASVSGSNGIKKAPEVLLVNTHA